MRVAFVTIGQSPRPDIVPELLALVGPLPHGIAVEQFGALDGLAPDDVETRQLGRREGRLYTRMADGAHRIVGMGLVATRLQALLDRLDQQGFDLIVLISTGIFRPFRLQTPFIDGQAVVDAWIAALLMGDCELGLIHPLPDQHWGFAFGTIVQNARSAATSAPSARLDSAARHVGQAAIILLHSVGYDEAMAEQVAALVRKPVVSARRIIAGAVRLRLESLPAARPARPPDGLIPAEEPGTLTLREREILQEMLKGAPNKEIAARLGISHRTVETHRSRVLAKLNARSATELIRRALIAGSG